MRFQLEGLAPFSGELSKGKRLSLTLPPNATYRSFYLKTNIPAQYIDAIEMANGSDLPMSLTAGEILMMENTFNRKIIANFIPLHVADITAKTLPGQESLERPTFTTDSHELRVRLSPELPVDPTYFLEAWGSFASDVTYAKDGNGNVLLTNGVPTVINRVRTKERRFERNSINNVNKGILTFDKLGLGPNLRAMYIKGDISKIEVIAKKGSTTLRHMEIPKDLNDFILESEYGLSPQDGYFTFLPVASGFMSDQMRTAYDSLTFKIHNESDAQTIEILSDVVADIMTK